jgi:hypothetical protein
MHVASSSVSLSMTALSDLRGWGKSNASSYNGKVLLIIDHTLAGIIWSPDVKMCLITIVPSSYPAMWGAPVRGLALIGLLKLYL